MITLAIFLLSINLDKKKCSISNTLRDTAHLKRSTFAKHLTIFSAFVSPTVLEIEHFSLFL